MLANYSYTSVSPLVKIFFLPRKYQLQITSSLEVRPMSTAPSQCWVSVWFGLRMVWSLLHTAPDSDIICTLVLLYLETASWEAPLTPGLDILSVFSSA